jgi:hypothetical protein
VFIFVTLAVPACAAVMVVRGIMDGKRVEKGGDRKGDTSVSLLNTCSLVLKLAVDSCI